MKLLMWAAIGSLLLMSALMVMDMGRIAYDLDVIASPPKTSCDAMLQAPRFEFTSPATCGLQEDEAGDVWSYIHEGHTRYNGALTDEDAKAWLLRHAGDGVIIYP